MNIVDLKNKFDELSCNLIREYTAIEKKYLEEKDKNIKDLTQVNSINESMVTTLEQNDLEIIDLNKQLSCKDQIIESLEQDIKDLKSQLTDAKEEQEEKTKFDMIRAQNDEIHAKSLEIERLNKIIRLRDEELEKEIEVEKEKEIEKVEKNIAVTIEEVVINDIHDKELVELEEKNETTEELDEKQETPEISEKSTKTEELENGKEIKDEEIKDEEIKDEEETEDMSDEEVSYSVVKYRKAEYYIDECEPPNVYQITDDEDVGPKIGTWEKNNKGKNVIKKLKNGKK